MEGEERTTEMWAEMNKNVEERINGRKGGSNSKEKVAGGI